MTNKEKFKEVFGLNISSRYISSMPQIWNVRALFLSKANYIDCADEWLESEYVAPTIIEADKGGEV